MAATEAVAALRPTSFDYSDPTDEIGDPWVQAAGDEARGHQPKESADDPDWLRNLMMSPKARDIERNLGFE
jgi:hypothetical protein